VRLLLAGLLAGSLASAVAAQDFFPRFRGRNLAPRFPTADSFDGTFNFCRLYYTSGRRYGGSSGWFTDYPDADTNFSVRLSELTKARVGRQPSGEPNHIVVRATDDEMFQCPFVFMEDPGSASLSTAEVSRLREYLLKGGFLWLDDFWGSYQWADWMEELARILPSKEYPVHEVTPAHPVYRTMFVVSALPQVPSIHFWRRGAGTSELGSDSAEPRMYGVSDAKGRLMVLMFHNTDVADSWEREGEDPQYFYQFSPNGYAVGINVMMYAMTH
jgi:hypothetical protein